MTEIKLDGLKVTIVEDSDGYVASVEFTQSESRQLVGDSEIGLLNKVIAVVQDHINKLTEDLQGIREVRSGKVTV